MSISLAKNTNFQISKYEKAAESVLAMSKGKATYFQSCAVRSIYLFITLTVEHEQLKLFVLLSGLRHVMSGDEAQILCC